MSRWPQDRAWELHLTHCGGTSRMSEQTRQRVIAAAEALGYRPNTTGRLLHEVSWKGNARHYRPGGRGREKVLLAEVFALLDLRLPG